MLTDNVRKLGTIYCLLQYRASVFAYVLPYRLESEYHRNWPIHEFVSLELAGCLNNKTSAYFSCLVGNRCAFMPVLR